MKRKHIVWTWALFCCTSVWAQPSPQQLDLSGTWRFQLDPMGFGKTPGSELYQAKLTETIVLPGTTDQGGKGIMTTARYVDRLTRKFEYCGQAWYQREVSIPESWSGKEIILHLERCHWETAVYVDGALASWDERLSTPNRFVLTKQLTPGMHTLTLCVDNRLKYPMDQWNHGTTEYTQTNWNGVVGKMELQAKEPTYIDRIDVYPDVDKRQVEVKTMLHNVTGVAAEGTIYWTLREKNGPVVKTSSQKVALSEPENVVSHAIDFGKEVKLWDEFNPALYEVEARLEVGEAKDTQKAAFGMRKVEQGKHHVMLNGRNIHLRGALDCCVFPLTGYPATDVRSGVDLSDPDFDLTQLYAVLDNRFALNVYYHSATFGDSGQPLDMSEGGKDSPSFSENATRTGYYLAKFVSKKSAMLNPIQTLNSVHYNPLLRKSEVLLNFAEAANEAWGNPTVKAEGCLYSAYEILKTIRSQAGGINFDLYLDEMAQSKDSFRKLIQNERRLEFTFENHRYFDMRRWVLPLNEEVEGVAVTRKEDGTFSFKVQKVEQRKYEVKNYFMPLPYAELEKNKNLMNNQGWE